FALPASVETTSTRRSDVVLISVSIFPALTRIINSPATPPVTNAAPSNPNTSKEVLGFVGGRKIPRLNSCKSSRCSLMMTKISNATPMTTRADQKLSQESSDDQDASKLLSSVLSADSSIKK